MVKSIRKKSITGLYRFLELRNREYTLVRGLSNNRNYIARVAALSFHKALFGISELKALENLSTVENNGGLRMSKAINTYYTVYHLITLMMLIDKENPITIKFRHKLDPGERIPIEIDEELLNREGESPEIWEELKSLESDLASRLTHGEIKKYCKEVRENFGNKLEPVKIVYEAFISEQTNIILYEKICYIRDRVVYRPTCALNNMDGGIILTSKDVRKEIDTLPNWEQLYKLVTKIHDVFLKLQGEQEEFGKQISVFYKVLVFYIWNSRIKNSKDYVQGLGWTEEEIKKYKATSDWEECSVEEDEVQFSSYLSHLIEIADVDRIKLDLRDLWEPLKTRYIDSVSHKK
ncbi:hypothetical protein [Bacillus thuringiensis]|uniref:hypothetical protein n=1 Tax=Bacillus thuringiensis TaxID=1428 RepID=UPI000BFA2E75|nr:hypothetical protein [Bacillus thuringiensis]PEW28486.1 hypothetical protein CN427_11690 [Bacillus thuringiensis]